MVRIPPSQKRKIADVGVYRKDGEIYIVIDSTKNPGFHYAKKLVISPPRMTETGEVVDFDYEHALGMAYRLAEKDRMSVDDLREFLIKYRKCVKCGKELKAASTLKRAEELGQMLGKRCAQKLGLLGPRGVI